MIGAKEQQKMFRSLLGGCLIVAVGAATSALADGAFPRVANETVLYECTDCHLAYQPQMLPRRSWRKRGITTRTGLRP